MAFLISIGITGLVMCFIEFDKWCKKQWLMEDYETFLEEGTGHD